MKVVDIQDDRSSHCPRRVCRSVDSERRTQEEQEGREKRKGKEGKEDKSVRQDCFAARSLQFVSFVFDDLDGKKTAKRREEERKRVSLTLLVNTL